MKFYPGGFALGAYHFPLPASEYRMNLMYFNRFASAIPSLSMEATASSDKGWVVINETTAENIPCRAQI